MATAIVDNTCENKAGAFWQAIATAFRDVDVDHVAHNARVFKTRATDAVEECVVNTSHRIKQHPFAAVGAAFAIGIPAGILIGWFAGHRTPTVRS